MTNAQLARNRLKSENISNAADKYITQQGVKDQIQLEKDKANIYSKMYNPGVYNRLLGKLDATGTDTTNLGTVPKPNVNPFDQFRNKTYAPYTGPSGAPIQPVNTLPADQQKLKQMPTGALRRYFKGRNTYAAGGMMSVLGQEGPGPKGSKVAKVPGVQQTGENPNDLIFSDPITRNSRLADIMNQVVAGGYHPYNSVEGRNALSQVGSYFNPQFTTDFTTRALQLQGEPGYTTMTPEQRLQRYYSLGKGGTSELDKFISKTGSYGGNPSAFYQNSPVKAAGGSIHINPANKGKFTASADAAGMGVQEFASHVLADPNASPLLKKRANFARNATKFNHAMGGKMVKPFC
jgi:hypothetical protein